MIRIGPAFDALQFPRAKDDEYELFFPRIENDDGKTGEERD